MLMAAHMSEIPVGSVAWNLAKNSGGKRPPDRERSGRRLNPALASRIKPAPAALDAPVISSAA
jgi:hypothetical protein